MTSLPINPSDAEKVPAKDAQSRARRQAANYELRPDEGFCIVEVIFDKNLRAVDYRFLEVNESFEKQTGLVDASGKRMRELAPLHEEYWFEIYGDIALTGKPARFMNWAEELNRWYEVYAFRVGNPAQRQVAIYFDDMTLRKQMETNANLLASVTHDLARLRTVDEIMRQVGARIGEYLKLSICCFVEINETADISHVTHEWRRDAGVPSLLGKYKLAEYFSADFQKVLRAGEAFVVDDTETDPRTDAKNYERLQLRSFVCVHLVRDGEWKFMFNVHHSTPHEWRVDELELLREITTRLWARLERAYAEETLQKKERELQVANERLQLATRAAGVGAFEWNIQTNTNYWTPELEALYGLPPGGFTGRNGGDWAKHVHPEDREEALAAAMRAVEQCTEFNIEFRVVWADGSVHWLSGRAQVFCDVTGKALRMVGVNIDVTQRKLDEEKLRESERRERERAQELAVVIESIPMPVIIVHDPEAQHMTGNRAADNLVKIPRGAEISMSAPEPLKPRHFKTFKDGRELRLDELPAQRAARGELVKEFEFELHFDDGAVRNLLGYGTPLQDGQGKPRGAVHMLVDITERKQAEAIMRQNDGLFAALVEQAPTGVYVVDSQFRLQQINARALPIFSKVDVTKGRNFEEVMKILWGDEVGGQLADIFRHTLKTGEPYVSPNFKEFRQDLGEEKAYDWQTQRVTLPDGSHGVVCYFNDITQQSRETQASQQLAAIVESSEDAIISKDLHSIITSWNRGAEHLFGYSAAEVVGKPITILMPPERLNEEPTILQRIRRGEPIQHYETIRRRKDGKLIEISLTVSPIKNAEGKVIGASKIARDITEQKQAERELEKAHQEVVAASRAKDDFLAALSHELRTPLGPALLIASEAADDPALAEGVRSNFETIRKNIELEARLIDDLLDLTRITNGKMILNLARVNAHEILSDAIETIQGEQQDKKIQLETNLQASNFFVKGEAVRLQQIFWNVLKNGVKFTPEGGKILVETSNPSPGMLILKITDTGIGMSKDEVARVFAAFAQGDHARAGGSHRFGGLGLGLAISKNLVELHAGRISAESPGVNLGATFVIELPLAEELAVKKGNENNLGPKKTEDVLGLESAPFCILLVEDHEITRTVLTQLLTRRNYKVIAAGCIARARELAGEHKINLLISDIGLPDGNGNDLMNELNAQYGLKGIALTGYGMEEDIARGKAAGFLTHLIKPVRIQSLETALAAVKNAR